MSILFSSDHVDIVDCSAAFAIPPHHSLHPQDFQLDKPYFASSKSSPAKKQKISVTDHQTQERHDHLRPFVTAQLEACQAYWDSLPTPTELPGQPTNDPPPLNLPDWIPMANAARRFAQQDELPLDVSQDLQDLPLLDLFNRKVINDSDQCSSLHVASFGQYLVPRHTKFVMSDLDNIDLLRSENDVFDLIVMDPPWPNKSVHRSTDYETQDIYDLFHLPIKSLIKNQGLVAVWVTNKPKYRRFILDKLFKAWQMTCVGEWLWLKVTSSGEPVFPLDSPHRKPYEQLILGRYQPDDTSPTLPNPPQQHVLISVPSIRHSRKPPLGEVLADFLPKQPACLELFARCLTPGWTSWGNECLKFQHESYFISNDTPHSPSAS